MSLYTALEPRPRLNEIIKARVSEGEPSPVNDALSQYKLSEETCREIAEEIITQVDREHRFQHFHY
jgi:hypothetical protein